MQVARPFTQLNDRVGVRPALPSSAIGPLDLRYNYGRTLLLDTHARHFQRSSTNLIQ
jgi:hypothetical protein